MVAKGVREQIKFTVEKYDVLTVSDNNNKNPDWTGEKSFAALATEANERASDSVSWNYKKSRGSRKRKAEKEVRESKLVFRGEKWRFSSADGVLRNFNLLNVLEMQEQSPRSDPGYAGKCYNHDKTRIRAPRLRLFEISSEAKSYIQWEICLSYVTKFHSYYKPNMARGVRVALWGGIDEKKKNKENKIRLLLLVKIAWRNFVRQRFYSAHDRRFERANSSVFPEESIEKK